MHSELSGNSRIGLRPNVANEASAYKADIRLRIFIAAALVSTFVALATISIQSIRAALMNPVKSLRSDWLGVVSSGQVLSEKLS